METNRTFEDEFISLCELLGANSSILIQNFGQPDDVDKNDDRTFIYFKNSKATFRVNPNDTVTTVFVPVADVMGRHLDEESSYYTLKGIKKGMTKNEVLEIWGQPQLAHPESNYWNFDSIAGCTNKGQNYESLVVFKETEDGIIVSSFTTSVVKKNSPTQTTVKPKSGCFVATACYGDYNATEFLILRNYRDNVLLKTNLGRTAVSIYYRLSPPIARFIEKSVLLKAFIRKNILAPIVLKIMQNQ